MSQLFTSGGQIGSGQAGDSKSAHHILGLSEPKWLEQKNLVLMTIISTIVGKNPLEEME